MFYILLLFFSCVGALIYFSRKYNNPYKLIYILGKKGSFKSTFMVYLMLLHSRLGWTVYTNMQDVLIPGVRIFDVYSLAVCAPPKRTVVFVDEAGLIWDNRAYKTFDNGYTELFKLQRKYGFKCYINSQALDVDKKIRDLIDYAYLMTGFCNCIGIARRVKRKVGIVDASSQGESRFADNYAFDSIFTWKFIWGPRYFKYFDSFKAPERPMLDFTTVVGDISLLEEKSPLKALKRHFGGSDDETT